MSKEFKTDIISLWMVESAIENGWEVYAYSQYGKDGVPKYAEIRKEIFRLK